MPTQVPDGDPARSGGRTDLQLPGRLPGNLEARGPRIDQPGASIYAATSGRQHSWSNAIREEGRGACWRGTLRALSRRRRRRTRT